MFDRKMFLKCKSTGKFVQRDLEAFKEKEIPTLWRLVDSEEEATNDPAMVMGEDLTMLLVMEMKEKYDCNDGFECYTPEPEQREEPQVQREMRKHNTIEVGLALTGGGAAMGRLVASAEKSGNIVVIDSLSEIADAEAELKQIWNGMKNCYTNVFITAQEIYKPEHELPRHARFSHRRPELAYGKKFNQKPRGRIR